MRKFILLLLLPLLAACATTDSLKPGQGGSVLTVNGKGYNQVWNAATKTVSRQLTITQSDKENGVIKAEKGAGLTTWGEVVGVFISPPKVKQKTYTVEVKSMKRGQLQVTGQDWEQTIIEGIKAELDI